MRDFAAYLASLAEHLRHYYLDGCSCVICRQIRAAYEEWKKAQC